MVTPGMTERNQLAKIGKADAEEIALRAEIFHLVDLAKAMSGLSDYALCKAAKVDKSTYWRIKQNPHRWQRATMRRLIRALTTLQAMKEAERRVLADRISAIGKRPRYRKKSNERNAA